MLNHDCESVDLILIGCVKSKHRCASLARDLYASTAWKYRRSYAESHYCPWYILSAKHGLLDPDTWIEPYDLALKTFSPSERRAWSQRVFDDLVARVPVLGGKVIEVHAGKLYVEHGLGKRLSEAGAVLRLPLGHVAGQGRQHVWYREHIFSCPRQGRG